MEGLSQFGSKRLVSEEAKRLEESVDLERGSKRGPRAGERQPVMSKTAIPIHKPRTVACLRILSQAAGEDSPRTCPVLGSAFLIWVISKWGAEGS